MNTEQKTRQGVILALCAYFMWGVAPIYFKAINNVSPLEILTHRVIWSFFLLAGLLHVGKHWGNVRLVFKNKTKMLYLTATSVIIGSNWLIYIWAIHSSHLLEASLGYYINPLINVLFGMMFLGERLRRLQWVAVLLASTGVVIQLVLFGSVPIVSFALAISFALYGLLRKKVNVDALTGLFVETLIILPIAAIYLFGIADSATSNLLNNDYTLNILLISAGVVTTLPLLCFTGAATRLNLSTLGFFQYIGPSCMFLLAVLVYQEPFSADKAITFAFIWAALGLFCFDGIRNQRAKR